MIETVGLLVLAGIAEADAAFGRFRGFWLGLEQLLDGLENHLDLVVVLFILALLIIREGGLYCLYRSIASQGETVKSLVRFPAPFWSAAICT